MAEHATDLRYLYEALALAATHQGATGENPSVGCLIVKNGNIIGSGVTALGGRPHAEPQALEDAGDAARGATVYVTLEPCAHYGQTPPCAKALIEAGVARVVMATTDPDPRVNGGGKAMLEKAGISCEHIDVEEAHAFYKGFFRRIRHGLPEVTVKAAISADNCIVRHSTQWITGPEARNDGHQLRANHQAILTGINTVMADDPELTCRITGMAKRSPTRIVLDRHARLPLSSKLVKSAEIVPVWLLTHHEAIERNASHVTELREHGVVVHALDNPKLPLLDVLQLLGREGVHRLLVEAGPTLTQAFLDLRLADHAIIYQSPDTLGPDGSGMLRLPETVRSQARREVAPDTRTIYKLDSCLPD